MSDLLNSASLVMIPSGYKEDVVYSEVPTNGNGDLSFTRASNGTRVNSAGLVEVCPWNLLFYSEQFDNAAWAKSNCSISSNSTTAPNGTITADKLVEDSTTSIHRISQNQGSINGVFFAYAKAGERTKVAINTSPVDVGFDLSNGTVIDLGFGTSGASIESVGNGWYRISLYLGVANSTYFLGLLNSSNQQNYTGDGTSGAYVWGAQLNIGSTAKPYFPTTDRLNVPRLTYQNGGGGCPSLLLEKQSTNLVLYSEQFDNAGWLAAGGITVTANATTSPDGTQNADLLSHGNFGTYLYQNLGTLSGTITTSIFVKKGSQSSIAFGFVSGGFGGGMSVIFDFDTQTFGTPTNYSNFTSISATYQSLGNGWYRLNLTGTTATSTGYYYVLGSLLDSFSVNAYLWGAQIEASSYATSYIGPTTSSSATRVADACSKTGISSLIGQTEGTFFAYIKLIGNTGNFNVINTANNSTNSITMHIESNQLRGYAYANSVIKNDIMGGTFASGNIYKVAYAYKSGSAALYYNGIQIGVGSDTFTFSSSISEIAIADDTTYFSYQESIQILEAVIFPTRLTNAELASLTTI